MTGRNFSLMVTAVAMAFFLSLIAFGCGGETKTAAPEETREVQIFGEGKGVATLYSPTRIWAASRDEFEDDYDGKLINAVVGREWIPVHGGAVGIRSGEEPMLILFPGVASRYKDAGSDTASVKNVEKALKDAKDSGRSSEFFFDLFGDFFPGNRFTNSTALCRTAGKEPLELYTHNGLFNHSVVTLETAAGSMYARPLDVSNRSLEDWFSLWPAGSGKIEFPKEVSLLGGFKLTIALRDGRKAVFDEPNKFRPTRVPYLAHTGRWESHPGSYRPFRQEPGSIYLLVSSIDFRPTIGLNGTEVRLKPDRWEFPRGRRGRQ